jgi:hypothetical protein
MGLSHIVVVAAVFFCLLNAFLSLRLVLPKAFPRPRATCPLCNFAPLGPALSTRRDVVLASAFSDPDSSEFFVRTLRSTGSRARIVLFLSSSSAHLLRFFSACGVEPVVVERMHPTLAAAPRLARYYFYQQWLSEHASEVDRVLHADAFDIVFQSDPFFEGFNESKLYLIIEPVTISQSHWTLQSVRQCYTDVSFADEPLSSAAVLAGGVRPFTTYLNRLLGVEKWSSCFGHSLDVAHHNFMLYSGGFGGIEIGRMGCASPWLGLTFCCKKARCTLSRDGVMFGNSSDQAPAVIHQYNRWDNLTMRNTVMCPEPQGGLLADVRYGTPARIERLPPLITAYPQRTLWPP